MLKVRCFKTTGDNRPFLSKFDVKLGSWGIIHTGETSPLEVSTKPLHLPPGSTAGFTPRARSASLDLMRNLLRNLRGIKSVLQIPGSRRIYTTSAEREFDGVGWVDGCMVWTEDQMSPSIFLILCGYIGHVHIYMYSC